MATQKRGFRSACSSSSITRSRGGPHAKLPRCVRILATASRLSVGCSADGSDYPTIQRFERAKFMAAKTVNVGLVGQKFMGKAHSNAYMTVGKFFDVDPRPVMKAVCGRDEGELKEFAERFGWEGYETD